MCAVGVVGVLLLALRVFAADVYDGVIVWMTARWYAAVFEKLNKGDRVLDVGIGTATALVKNKTAMLEKHLSFVGIDYEAAYVKKAEAVLREEELWRAVPEGTEGYRPGEFYCRVLERSIYDPDLAKLCATDAGMEGSDNPGKGSDVPEELRFGARGFSSGSLCWRSIGGVARVWSEVGILQSYWRCIGTALVQQWYCTCTILALYTCTVLVLR